MIFLYFIILLCLFDGCLVDYFVLVVVRFVVWLLKFFYSFFSIYFEI